MAERKTKDPQAINDDVPYTMRLPDGRTVFILLRPRWCERDVTGELLLRPEAVRFLDRVRVLAMKTPGRPTPGYIRTLRGALGLTQARLAERIGVDRMTVARWEWGKVAPRADAAKALDKLRREAGRKGIMVAA
jgi:DNA-binding transcriptional regulator YiaG